MANGIRRLLKKKGKELKTSIQQSQAAAKIRRQKVKAARLKERQKLSIELAKKKERVKAEIKLRRFKARREALRVFPGKAVKKLETTGKRVDFQRLRNGRKKITTKPKKRKKRSVKRQSSPFGSTSIFDV